MRRLLLIFSFCTGTTLGGTVQWDRAFVDCDPDYSGKHDLMVSIGAPSFLPTWGDGIEGGWRLTAMAMTFMEYANSFALASVGDIVGPEFMSMQSDFFSYAEFGKSNSGRSDYNLDIMDGESVYLAFQNVTAQGTRYGWFELGVSMEHELQMLSSAWDISGDPIVVGGVPEPSSGVLLAMGLAMLGLRRKTMLM